MKITNILAVSDFLDYPYSTTVRLGQQAYFYCCVRGSYLYWFIDGVHFDNMTTEELEIRGHIFNEYYNHDPPYYIGCDIQHLHLYMTGNCFNNNTHTHIIKLIVQL